jgi:hypothetical protein
MLTRIAHFLKAVIENRGGGTPCHESEKVCPELEKPAVKRAFCHFQQGVEIDFLLLTGAAKLKRSKFNGLLMILTK